MANNFCRQNRKIDVNTCNKTGDKSRRGCKQNIVVRHFELERLHLSLWRSWLQKYPANVHTNSANPNKKNPPESGFKNMRFWCADSLEGRVDGRSSRMKKYAISKQYGFVWTEALYDNAVPIFRDVMSLNWSENEKDYKWGKKCIKTTKDSPM